MAGGGVALIGTTLVPLLSGLFGYCLLYTSMAAMLQPIDTFYPEIADIWVEDIQNIEIAELTCMNLFQHLPYAPACLLYTSRCV